MKKTNPVVARKGSEKAQSHFVLERPEAQEMGGENEKNCLETTFNPYSNTQNPYLE